MARRLGKLGVYTITKKGHLRQCNNYRTIALVSHASKVLLKIILERIRSKTESEISEVQAEFRRGRGTRDHIKNLRTIMQKAHDHQQPLFMCFVEYIRRHLTLSHQKLWVTMLDMGYPPHLRLNYSSKLTSNVLRLNLSIVTLIRVQTLATKLVKLNWSTTVRWRPTSYD